MLTRTCLRSGVAAPRSVRSIRSTPIARLPVLRAAATETEKKAEAPVGA